MGEAAHLWLSSCQKSWTINLLEAFVSFAFQVTVRGTSLYVQHPLGHDEHHVFFQGLLRYCKKSKATVRVRLAKGAAQKSLLLKF